MNSSPLATPARRSRVEELSLRRRRWRRSRALAASVLVFSGLLALASGIDTSALAAVGLIASPSPTPAAAPPPRAVPVAIATHAPSGCEVTGSAQRVVETYLSHHAGTFGQVTVDGTSSADDCLAIRAFQSWAGMSHPSGIADATTGDIARRLASVAPARCHAGSATTVCVDLTEQIMWVQRSGAIIFGPVPVRTGRAGEATPPGTYAITQKKADTTSTEFGTKLPYWERFYKDYGFHGAETYMYADIPGSHGCVNLLLRDAKALFGLTREGTPVHVFGAKPGT